MGEDIHRDVGLRSQSPKSVTPQQQPTNPTYTPQPCEACCAPQGAPPPHNPCVHTSYAHIFYTSGFQNPAICGPLILALGLEVTLCPKLEATALSPLELLTASPQKEQMDRL